MQSQNKSPPVLPQTAWRDRVFAEIDQHLKTLEWDLEFAKSYVSTMFPGIKSRRQLTDHELRLLNRRLDWAVSVLKNPPKTPFKP
jgi:hypothetical protein